MNESSEEEIVNHMDEYTVTRDNAIFLQKFIYLGLKETPESVKK